jgi:uncharacterized protein YwqG
LIALLRPSIRLWPQPDSGDPLASRFGGLPAVPARFEWPFANEEPLWFLAQINCAELGSRTKAFGLPSKGLLAFFGDHDDVNGCGSVGGGAVFYFANTKGFTLAALPLGDFEPQIQCGMGFYESYELPHAESDVIVPLGFSGDERSTYIDLRFEVSTFALPGDRSGLSEFSKLVTSGNGISKLFGWPDLIQSELDTIRYYNDVRLLLQIGNYHDGSKWHDWGPGGIVYFTIRQEDLAAKHFDRAELDMQCT